MPFKHNCFLWCKDEACLEITLMLTLGLLDDWAIKTPSPSKTEQIPEPWPQILDLQPGLLSTIITASGVGREDQVRSPLQGCRVSARQHLALPRMKAGMVWYWLSVRFGLVIALLEPQFPHLYKGPNTTTPFIDSYEDQKRSWVQNAWVGLWCFWKRFLQWSQRLIEGLLWSRLCS